MNAVEWICGGLESLRVKMEIYRDEREAENELLALAGGDFVYALKDIFRDLASCTGRSYGAYLEESKQMLLAGSHPTDVIYHYAMLAYRNEEREP